MLDSLSRRQRRILWTSAFITLLVVGSAAALWSRGSEESYRPGEQVEGLTATLSRDAPEALPSIYFRNVADEAGIRFEHFAGERSSQLPEDMGSGAAWIDYNRDGWPDLFVANVAGPLTMPSEERAQSGARSRLYRNEGDGTFTEVGEEMGLDIRSMGMGVGVGDYDNDGWPDLFLTTYGENRLFRNREGRSFEEVTEETGLGGRHGFWAGAAWGDYNCDGHLDLYVPGYVDYDPVAARGDSTSQYDIETPAALNPSTFPPHRNLFYRNDGDGTFTEVSKDAGVANPDGRGLQATWADVTGDGRPDLYVANDISDNVLYRNEGDGAFSQISRQARVADYRGAMGLAVGDWNHDRQLDLFVTHWIAQENAFYVNQGRPPETPYGEDRTIQFMDEADRYGLGQVALDYVGWGTSFFDYDNDGNLDLFVVNGSTLQQKEDPRLLRPEPNLLFWNRGAGNGFYDASSIAKPGTTFRSQAGETLSEQVSRGAAVADYDRDGDLDLFVVNHSGPARLYRNEGDNDKHWLAVRLEGTTSNRSAIGARMRVHADSTVRVREVGAQGPYLSQNTLVQHVGLGEAESVDSLTVQWPSGGRQVLEEVPVDTLLHVEETIESRTAALNK
jgi:hypothetical protein